MLTEPRTSQKRARGVSQPQGPRLSQYAGNKHFETIQEIAGGQTTLSRFYVAIHWLVAIVLSIKAIINAVQFSSGSSMMLVNALGVIVADLSLLGVMLAIKANEVVGDDLRKAKALKYIAVTDILLGAVAPAWGIADAYYGWGMALFLIAQLMLWFSLIAYGTAATAVREGIELALSEALANLRYASARSRATIALKLEDVRRKDSARKIREHQTGTYYAELHGVVSGWRFSRGTKRKAKQSARRLAMGLGTWEPSPMRRLLPASLGGMKPVESGPQVDVSLGWANEDRTGTCPEGAGDNLPAGKE